MELTDIQRRIFEDRYASCPGETVEQMWRRVAMAVANNEGKEHEVGKLAEWDNVFFDLLKDFKFVPGGRILSTLGTDTSATAMNCYVIPSPEDSRAGIMRSLSEWIEIQSKGGGVGINLSSLRPAGAPVKGVNGESSGPVNWAQLFAFSSKEIIIQGGSRRGAAMIMLDVDHPDILSFIHAKETPGVLEGANISVCISDEFMQAVKQNLMWELVFDGEVYGRENARDLWREICEAAWRSGEPGIYFMGRTNEQANSGYFEVINATNPCGEVPLGPYGACLLGSMNLAAYVRDGRFDVSSFTKDVITAVRFLDNVIDVSAYPLPECEDAQKRIRRLGLGVMGLADALIKLGLRYGSPEAIKQTERFFRSLQYTAYLASVELAQEKGSFPLCGTGLLERPFIRSLPADLRQRIEEHGLRNCYLLAQAPTGTIALLAGVNSGIEPYFDFSYQRKDRTGDYEVASQWTGHEGQDYMVTAHDLTPEEHVAMQAAAQRYVDQSISKTVNAPADHTVEDVENLYMLAYDEGLKSIAYYRDGSRNEQVLYRKEESIKRVLDGFALTEKMIEDSHRLGPMVPPSGKFYKGQTLADPKPGQSPVRRKLPDTRISTTHKFRVGDTEGYLTVGLFDDGTPGELFVTVSKAGSTVNGLLDGWATQVSYSLQYGVPVEKIANKFMGTRFEPSGMTGNPDIPMASSILDYISRWLDRRFGDTAKMLDGLERTPWRVLGVNKPERTDVYDPAPWHGDLCPECSGRLIPADGCSSCHDCGYSRCG